MFFKRIEKFWKTEKLLIMSKFSSSLCVFKKPVLQTRKNQDLFWKGLNIGDYITLNINSLVQTESICRQQFNGFPSKPLFVCVYSTNLLKTLWEKEKLLVMSNFSFSHCVFYPFGKVSAIFIKFKIIVCKLFQFGRT